MRVAPSAGAWVEVVYLHHISDTSGADHPRVRATNPYRRGDLRGRSAAGVRVLEMANVITGPYAGMLLSDLVWRTVNSWDK
jgi:hypothetical protein